ncbi:hypothetical protein [Streptomyces sp. NPDC101181]|uniref:hypothetical protein n=1 Tax=Streptomyces sp. NPDC101181 TaxID=3366125 RepID=UPI00380BF79C
MVQKPESDTEPKERRIDLSVPQVAGSAVAAVAAAVLASQLGVYGTIVGAGVMSVVATCGGSVFQHFFRRTGEQIREVTVQVTHPDGRQVTAHTKETTPSAQRAAERRAEPEPAEDATTVLPTLDPGQAPGVDPDPESTQVLRPGPDRTQMLDLGDARTRMLRVPPAHEAAVDEGRTRQLPRAGADDGRTRVLRQAGPDPAGDDGAFGDGVTHGTRLRGWKRPVLAAAVVFGVSMAGITAYEAIAGNDLSGGTGTTLGSVVRGGGDRDAGPADPTPSGGTGRNEDGDAQRETPGDGTGSSPAPVPSDGGASPDAGTGTGGVDPTTEPTPTPSRSGGGDPTSAPTPTSSASGDGETGTPRPTGTAPGAGEPTPPGAG